MLTSNPEGHTLKIGLKTAHQNKLKSFKIPQKEGSGKKNWSTTWWRKRHMFLICWDSMAVRFINEISSRKWVKSPCADDSNTESNSNLWTLVSTYIAVAEIHWRAETCFWYHNHQNAHGARVSSYVLPLTFKNYRFTWMLSKLITWYFLVKTILI